MILNCQGQLVYQPVQNSGNMQNLDDRSAELPVDGHESIPTTLSQRSAARPAPNLSNIRSINDPRLISGALYELQLLSYWARSRPVARILLATMLERRLCRGIRAAWTLWRMQVLSRYDMFGCRGCGAFPTEPTCAQCDTKWCRDCSDFK